MAQITFFEKPGCINNTKQKAWLKTAGHEVQVVNLLEHSWSKVKRKYVLRVKIKNFRLQEKAGR